MSLQMNQQEDQPVKSSLKLLNRAVAVLVWADANRVVPDNFTKDDLFVSMGGEVFDLMSSDSDAVVWLPRTEDLVRIKKDGIGLSSHVDKKNEDMWIITCDLFGKKVEGAGITSQDAVISFLEGLRHAYKQRSLESDRLRN